MQLAIGNDHAGLDLKKEIMSLLEDRDYAFTDCGTFTTESCDYPDFAAKVCQAVQSQNADLGILICGTGIGMSIAANKHIGIRAALVQDIFSAQATRQHNNSNILCLGARVLETQIALDIVDTWLNTPFEGGRHQRRLNKLAQIEQTSTKTFNK
jgi:ribose 5-phosphate isomerase B